MVTDEARDFLTLFNLEAEKGGENKAWLNSRSSSEYGVLVPYVRVASRAEYATKSSHPLNLTAAQKEYLLKMTFAQRAFLTSYTTAVIDNKPVIATVCTLKIASLSSRYLQCLRGHDFWAALPNLRTLEFIISPDWRDMSRNEALSVDVPTIMPTTAVATLSAFLHEFISPLELVRNLSLGWLDGGEHAIGNFGRNQHILCAPLILQPALRHHNSADNIVLFPHILQLTLNNCWITPSVLELFIQQHKTTLQDLKLTSVSLTAPTRPAVLLTATPSLYLEILAAPPRQPDAAASLSHVLSQIHRPGSWPQIIDNITPGTTLAELRRGGHPRGDRGVLRRIHFNSCGNVRLGYMEDFHQGVIGHYLVELPEDLRICIDNLEPAMMCDNDAMLGEIHPHMPQKEHNTLHAVWHMSFGWGDDPRARDNLEDGKPQGGSGRFTGFVERVEDPSS